MISSREPKILILGEVHHAKTELEELKAISDFQYLQKDTTRDQFIENCLTGSYSNIIAILRTVDSGRSTGPFDADLISHLPSSIRFICHNGAGYESIDVEACTKKGIAVSNTPDVVNEATADIAMFLILGALRRAWAAESSLRRSKWSNTISLARDPKNLILGVLGMGGIGTATSLRAASFGFKIQYHNRRPVENLKGDFHRTLGGEPRFVGLRELLVTSDIISVHLPLSAETRHFIGTKEIEAMKQGVIIVNTARGPVIDEDAMVKGLESGKIWSVGLDVFEFEPEIHPGLLKSENAVLLPHIGTATLDTRRNMEALVIQNLKTAISQGRLVTPVPEQVAKYQK